MFGYRVVYGNTEFLTKAGFGKVARLPFIYDSRPGYHRLANRFLIDRGLGVWDPVEHGIKQSLVPPSTSSMKSFADRLANFLEWCEVRGIAPLSVEYGRDMLGRYQKEMSEGIWARDGAGLAARTINARVAIACEWLSWAADKGLRQKFEIATSVRVTRIGNHKSSVGHLAREVASRRGKKRPSKRRLGFPEEREISTWLKRVYDERGRTEGLLCETILETAVRREEMACWRVNSLALDPKQWQLVSTEIATEHQSVYVDVKYGAKGPEYGRDHGDKIGPENTIRVPLQLAYKLHEYRTKIRPKSLLLALRNGASRAEQERIRRDSVHLFLNPATGLRYSGQAIYDIWRSVERPRGWSPHSARDFWACSILWRRMQRQNELLRKALDLGADDSTVEALQGNALSIIELEIQPQLRHVSRETTLLYVKWLSDRLGINLNLHQRWADDIGEGEDETAEES